MARLENTSKKVGVKLLETYAYIPIFPFPLPEFDLLHESTHVVVHVKNVCVFYLAELDSGCSVC